MSKYQQQIIEAIKNGAKLQCTEGTNWRAWLKYPHGEIKYVRRDSANKVCQQYSDILIFGKYEGISYKLKNKNETYGGGEQ
jgi:hypothetical protein